MDWTRTIGAVVIAVLGSGGLWGWLNKRKENGLSKRFDYIDRLEKLVAAGDARDRQTQQDLNLLRDEFARYRALQIKHRIFLSRIYDFLKELDPQDHNGRLASIMNEMDSTINELTPEAES